MSKPKVQKLFKKGLDKAKSLKRSFNKITPEMMADIEKIDIPQEYFKYFNFAVEPKVNMVLKEVRKNKPLFTLLSWQLDETLIEQRTDDYLITFKINGICVI